MTIYYFLWLIIMIGFLWRRPKYKERWFIFVASVIILMVGLRNEQIGFDTHNYLDFFMHQTSRTTFYTRESIEPGFVVFFALLELIWKNQNFATFATALISLYPIFLLIKRKSPNPNLSIFLFCSFSIGSALLMLEMAAMRQCLAMGLYAMGLYYYTDNNYKFEWKSMLCFLAMIFIHYSSILVIFLFLLERIQINKKIYYYALSTVACLSGYFIGQYVKTIYFLAETMNKGFYVSNYGIATNNLIPLIPYWGAFVFLIYITPDKKINSLWIKGFLLAVCFSGILQTFGMNIERICAYYYITTLIAIPEMLQYIKYKKIYKWSFYVVLLGYFTYKYFYVLQIASTLDYGQVPYKSFL